MSFNLYIDASNTVNFEIEYDYKRQDRQILSEHLSRSGRRYTYKWGDIQKRQFSVRFLSSATASIINSWWQNNVSLILQESGSVEVFSCKLANESSPIGQFEKPYNDQYRGTLELESY
jgi:hypothetical protein